MSAESVPLPPPSTYGSNLWPRLRAWVKSVWPYVWAFIKISPLTSLAIYTLLSLQLEENYPLSNYPMYSNPSPERPYYMITDGEGKPVPIQTLTGVTCPKIGKIFRSMADDMSKQLKIKAVQLTPEHHQAISMDMFAMLRREGSRKGSDMPPKLRLVKNYLSYENGQVIESPTLIGQE